ncbi:hypothetical protein JF634_09770 [Simonsiella muelleri]|jgi:hypothetical protein|uniref:Uncharacterized protein n=1 Tax=Simonsiella muelleri ATCC 29453 TaxID=641147 RepID=V9HMC9_9NEIS|nr:hypothetical protein [Simonsiella muelleri]AUX61397.1 hypothetical protein BWP33_05970 [Simonsiella muelleri ATCC 29453]EFG31084.1 hypothetical protein HMPREF9021_00913 [Simonsiella muelleri ATCC 29453]UBQ53451.1 hypothetical protein JF634_09770 [Simonsiella muelleri]
MSRFQNARLTAIRHIESENKLILSFANLPDYEMNSVVDFSLSGFFPHNILFDLYEYSLATLPARLAAEFPVLSYYLHSGEDWQIFYLSPQVGLGGIVVCATLGELPETEI